MSDQYGELQNFYGKANADVDVAATDAAKNGVIAVRSTLHTIFVQRITPSVLVDAAQSLIFQDDAGTPVLIAKTKASPGLGPMVPYDFGPTGVPLTQGKNLDIKTTAAGIGAKVHIEGYQKLTGVGAPLTTGA